MRVSGTVNPEELIRIHLDSILDAETGISRFFLAAPHLIVCLLVGWLVFNGTFSTK